MGFVVVISVPLILLVAILALACYLLGRRKGRTESTPMYYGPPAPPMAAGPPPKYLPNQAEVKNLLINLHLHLRLLEENKRVHLSNPLSRNARQKLRFIHEKRDGD
ncbi:unnamed protein product [Musa acuminata subsp. burmannicoides]